LYYGQIRGQLALVSDSTIVRVLYESVNRAASPMGRCIVEARRKKWGKREFVKQMQEWGKLGGRPKGRNKRRKAANDGGK
jgi:hypothetical protein